MTTIANKLTSELLGENLKRFKLLIWLDVDGLPLYFLQHPFKVYFHFYHIVISVH